MFLKTLLEEFLLLRCCTRNWSSQLCIFSLKFPRRNKNTNKWAINWMCTAQLDKTSNKKTPSIFLSYNLNKHFGILINLSTAGDVENQFKTPEETCELLKISQGETKAQRFKRVSICCLFLQRLRTKLSHKLREINLLLPHYKMQFNTNVLLKSLQGSCVVLRILFGSKCLLFIRAVMVPVSGTSGIATGREDSGGRKTAPAFDCFRHSVLCWMQLIAWW